MNRKIYNYFEIAAKLSTKRKDRRYFHLGAVGVRSDGVMVKSANGSTMEPHPECHAETRLSKKLDVGSIVYVARVTKNGEFALAKPCKNCQRTMRARGVKEVYYTTTNKTFEKLVLN